MAQKIKIIIADDHQLFADGVEQILSATNDFEVLAKVTNGKLLLQALNHLKPDLILLDINMPYLTGLEAAKLIKESMPLIKIVFLSMHYDSKILALARQYDIEGSILKNTTAADLKNTLLKIIKGERIFVLPKEFVKQSADLMDDDFIRRYKLSPREIEIIHFIKKGKASKEIAENLFLSIFTIETHRKNIFKKLNVTSAGQLISFANDNNI